MPNGNDLQGLLSTLARRLGTGPEQLKNSARAGDIQTLMKGMAPGDAEKLRNALSDQETVRELLNSPQAQELIRKLSGGK